MRASMPTSSAVCEPLPEDAPEPFEFEENIVGGRIPKQYIPSIEKGFRESIVKGPIAEYPVVGVKAIVDDGSYHEVDSSDRAFPDLCPRCVSRRVQADAPRPAGTDHEAGHRVP